jgi:hypothetical protein
MPTSVCSSLEEVHSRPEQKRCCLDWVSSTMTFNDPCPSSVVDGRCGWSWPKYCCKIPTCCCSMSQPTTLISNQFNGWRASCRIIPGAVVLISHDRAFLDNITKRTVEISKGKIYDYKAAYSDYEDLREERLEQELANTPTNKRRLPRLRVSSPDSGPSPPKPNRCSRV